MKIKQGQPVPATGAYSCEGCSEIFHFNTGDILPPCPCGGDTYLDVTVQAALRERLVERGSIRKAYSNPAKTAR